MDFLNIGSGEFVFLILLTILLVGPRRAVEWIQQASRFAARLQQEWRAVQRDVIREVEALKRETVEAIQPAVGIGREGQTLQQEVAGPRSVLREIAQEVRAAQEGLKSGASTPQSPPSAPSPPDILEPTDDFAG